MPSTRSTSAGHVMIFPDRREACREAADRIIGAIREGIGARGNAVLGLATGGTPIPVYEELVARHRAGEVSFERVSTYNLDEYYPIAPNDPNSYRAYMHRLLFSLVDLAPNRAHVFDGTVPEAFAAEHAATFDRWMAAEGGLDLQLLGLGRNAHIGFNEPSELPTAEALALPSRLASLHEATIAHAARDFGGDPSRVPRNALTVGVAPILAARSILILAFGSAKAGPVSRSISGPMTASVPGSLLQAASDRVTWMLDEEAAAGLA